MPAIETFLKSILLIFDIKYYYAGPRTREGAVLFDLTLLHYFRAAARAGSLTAAARQLRVGQPTLTVAMQKLERLFETTLFLRERGGIRLTRTGSDLLRYVDQLFLLVEEAEREIRGLESEPVGAFTLGCPDVMGAYFLPKFLSAFRAEAPRIQLTLWNGHSRNVHRALLDRTVDFGLVVNPVEHPDLVLIELFEDTTELFVSSAWKQEGTTLAQAKAQLRRGPLIFVDSIEQSRDDGILRQIEADGISTIDELRCGTLELVRRLVEEGVGVGILPRRVARLGKPGRIVPLHRRMPIVLDRIHLAFRADLHRTKGALLLKEALRKRGRELRKRLLGSG
jgi:DNA-binding transcriptional LysR family regulator